MIRGSSYSVMPPDQRKREQILHTAQKEAESLRQYQAAQKERQGQFRSVTQRLGGDAGRHPDISAVRSAQQQKARVDVMTKSTRDQARREEYRKETQRQEDEKVQKHKEKQRLKARDMELREKERALMCQHSTRQHWESQHMQVYPYQDDQGQGGAQAASAPGRTTAGRSQFPSQHTKYRQHKEEKRKAEEEEYERHKASQRQKGEYLQKKAEEEAQRHRDEVRSMWADRRYDGQQTEGVSRQHYRDDHHEPAYKQEHYLDRFGEDGSQSPASHLETMPLRSAIRTTSSYPDDVPSSSICGAVDDKYDQTHSVADDATLEWSSNRRPQSRSEASSTKYSAKHLTECQATLVSLGLPRLSLTELDILLKSHNGDLDRLANNLFEKHA